MTTETIYVSVGNETIRFEVPVKIFTRKMTIVTSGGHSKEYVVRCDLLNITRTGTFERIARKNFVDEFETLFNWCWFGETVAQRIQRGILEAFMVRE